MTEEIVIKAQKELPVEIVAIIDSSGSMGAIANDAIGGFNTFIEEQQKEEGAANFTAVLFSNSVSTLQESVSIADAVKFDHKNFTPRGSTALYDAVGSTINKFAALRKGGKVDKLVCAILTDGEENASREYTQENIKKLITEAEAEYGWIFVFLAANQDAFQAGGALGIQGSRTLNFAASGAGAQYAARGMSAYTSAFRVGGAQADYDSLKDSLEESEPDNK